ncbi:MAG: N-acetylglucosamine-6-phosphate deacetylase [Blautia sp.]|nr:N-acetylglucosamine-6-phosphate deacetylase [Blautia sp.]
MKTWIVGGYVYRYEKRRLERKNLCMEDGKITKICSPSEEIPEGDIFDVKGKAVVPGFIDVHTHGGQGADVNAATKEDFQKIGHFFAEQGTTTWLCSILTDTKEQTEKVIGEMLKHQENHENCADLLGIHLEGPFLSVEFKGAMPESLLREADIELLKEYQKKAKGKIRYITVSPEVEGIPEAISQIRDMGITVAIGHSGADYETSMECIKNGATACTHTCNAMKLFHQHFPAIMGAVLESDKVYCEAICDGRHLHPGSVRMILKAKGYDKVVAVTDSIMASGLPDGEYKLGVNDVIVKDGDAKLPNGVRAGSTLTTGTALKRLIEFTGESMEDVLPLLTMNPAKLIHAEEHIGSLEVGKDADILILDDDNNVETTFVKGKKIER